VLSLLRRFAGGPQIGCGRSDSCFGTAPRTTESFQSLVLRISHQGVRSHSHRRAGRSSGGHLGVTSRLHHRVEAGVRREEGLLELLGELVMHVVQPAVPFRGDCGWVVVHQVRPGVIDNPAVTAVLLSPVLIVAVSVLVRPHQRASLDLKGESILSLLKNGVWWAMIRCPSSVGYSAKAAAACATTRGLPRKGS
jgi:hypothetical protein